MISIIIPTYNRCDKLAEAIKSCILQEDVSKIIVIDDGSQDNTKQMVEELQTQFGQIMYINFSNNKGPSFARNIGLENVDTPYFSFLDSDDLFLKNRFEKALKLLQEDKNLDGTYEDVLNVEIDINGCQVDKTVPSILGLKENVPPSKLFHYIIRDRNEYFTIHSLLLRTSSVPNNITFDQTMRYGEDIDFIYQLAKNLRLIKIEQKPKIIRRMHGKNTVLDNEYNTREVRYGLINKWFKILINSEMDKVSARYIFWRKISWDYETNKSKIYFASKYVDKFSIMYKLLKDNPSLIGKLLF